MNLPKVIWRHIGSFLSFREAMILRCVCRRSRWIVDKIPAFHHTAEAIALFGANVRSLHVHFNTTFTTTLEKLHINGCDDLHLSYLCNLRILRTDGYATIHSLPPSIVRVVSAWGIISPGALAGTTKLTHLKIGSYKGEVSHLPLVKFHECTGKFRKQLPPTVTDLYYSGRDVDLTHLSLKRLTLVGCTGTVRLPPLETLKLYHTHTHIKMDTFRLTTLCLFSSTFELPCKLERFRTNRDTNHVSVDLKEFACSVKLSNAPLDLGSYTALQKLQIVDQVSVWPPNLKTLEVCADCGIIPTVDKLILHGAPTNLPPRLRSLVVVDAHNADLICEVRHLKLVRSTVRIWPRFW